ncbi:MAG TPA: D-aminoacyl-tRNA deacylase [Pseudogracilibacillus sp.]|nr:D-aminoacyl-tRNA deacylase [Pseudogracilibacillus sp.]
MKAVIQRVKKANVTVDGQVIGEIDHGLLVLLGVTEGDSEKDIETIVNKLINLRIFEDEEGKMNLSLLDVEGSILSVSQFTLYGDVRKGRRPSFSKAARPEEAEDLYDKFNEYLRGKGVEVETGQFGAMMDVSLINNGPVTFIIESIDGTLIEA